MDTRKTETPRWIAGAFLYLYSQCGEISRVKWHVSEECSCRGFKLKRVLPGSILELSRLRRWGSVGLYPIAAHGLEGDEKLTRVSVAERRRMEESRLYDCGGSKSDG